MADLRKVGDECQNCTSRNVRFDEDGGWCLDCGADILPPDLSNPSDLRRALDGPSPGGSHPALP